MTDASKLTARFFSEQAAIRRHLDLIERRLLPSVEEAVAFASTLHRCNVVPEREARQIADHVRTIDRMRLTAYLSELGGRFLPTIVEMIAEAEPDVQAYRRRLSEDEDYNVEAFDVVRNEINADTTEDERRELIENVVDSEVDMPVDDEDTRWTRDELLALFEAASLWAVFDAKTSRLDDFRYLQRQASDFEVASQAVTAGTAVNALRQAFILLVTLFDAAVFDLVRVALRRHFFVLVARLGTKDKVPLDTFKDYQNFEQLKDSLIEDQLRNRYLKDLIFFLDKEGVTRLPPDEDERLVGVVEVILRRNVHVHNGGRVDKTYLDKADASFNPFGFALGDYAPIDEPYWQAANEICARWVSKIGTWVDGLPSTTT